MTQLNAADSTRPFRNPFDVVILAVAKRFGNKSKEVERFLKFAVVGTIGAVVDFGTMFLVQATILPPHDALSVAAATTIAFCAAIISNFTWNRIWTYPDSRSRSVRKQLILFTFISLVGWLGRTLWISWAYLPMGTFLMPKLLPLIQSFRPAYIPSATAEGKLGTFAAMFIGVIVVMFWNFFANRYWTYNDID
ncbi:MAG: GtrA family protein [Anaerolineae bacterium]|nr:GtrA family protein [Anaerolineae bacterium]